MLLKQQKQREEHLWQRNKRDETGDLQQSGKEREGEYNIEPVDLPTVRS